MYPASFTFGMSGEAQQRQPRTHPIWMRLAVMVIAGVLLYLNLVLTLELPKEKQAFDDVLAGKPLPVITVSLLQHPERWALVSMVLLATAVTWSFMDKQNHSILLVIALLCAAGGLYALEQFALRLPLMERTKGSMLHGP